LVSGSLFPTVVTSFKSMKIHGSFTPLMRVRSTSFCEEISAKPAFTMKQMTSVIVPLTRWDWET